MTGTSDFSLLQRAKAFDLQALGIIYDRYSPGIYRYAYRLLNDVPLAEACVTEVFSRLLHALSSKGEHIRDLEAQLFKSALDWVESELKRSVASDQPKPNGGEPLGLPRNALLEAEDIRVALRRVSPEARAVLLLKFLESWDDRQISAVIDAPAHAMPERYRQALAELRQCLPCEPDPAVPTI